MKQPLSKLAILLPLAAMSGLADQAMRPMVGGSAATLCAMAEAQTLTVLPAPSGITGISNDGSVAVGLGGNMNVPGTILYEVGGVTTRIETFPYGRIGNDVRSPFVSGDGRILQNGGFMGVSYLIPRDGSPVTSLPGISGTSSFAGGLSFDGSVVVGTDFNQSGTFQQGWRWTASGGRQNLPFSAIAVSGDGNTVLGGDGTATGAVWHNGTITHLQSPPEANNPFNGVAATNSDGSLIVGRAGVFPTIWRSGQGAILPLLSGFTSGRATDTSNDGTVIVGLTSSESVLDVPFVWTPTRGTELITSYLGSYGIDLTAYQIYDTPVISADGRTFGLTGQSYADQSIHGIVVTIPAPATALIVSLGLTSIRRRR